jgi:UDPglucose--hexose-1-phosphate uridylyltransferase
MLPVETLPARGVCEVVVFTQDEAASLGTLPLWHVELLIDVWADRYEELGRLPEVAYVFPFENRGVEVGVTLHHPHGQIYAYPFVPPVPARELEQQRHYFERHGRGLLEDMIARELAEDRRLIYRGPYATAFMPVCARYSYEVWVAPTRPAPSCAALAPAERRDFARALKTVLLKFDGLWDTVFPYILAFHQAPTDGADHPEAHLHAEFYPAYRMRGRLKYLAGSEIGAGVFTADTVPEETVRELQAVEVNVDA